MPARVVRHLIVDNEAASALLSTKPADPKRAAVMVAIAAANGRRVAPTAVRGEAGWDRTDPAAANANRLIPADDPLDSGAADRIVQLRSSVTQASVVDAAVAVAAERAAAAGGIVEILTSDLADLRSLAGHLAARIDVTRL
jgi:hypothetical protein